MTEDTLPLVSVLFITYKRFDFLEQSVRAFLARTDYPNLEIVIADDGSGLEIQDRICKLPANVFALSPKNRGLGANNNNGLRHCTGKYILMIQDDCLCAGPPDYLKNTIRVLEANPNVGIINYYGDPHPLDTQRPLPGSERPCYIALRPYESGLKEHFLYTDQPHVISRAALDHLGYYPELRDMEACEAEYMRRWQNQTRFATAIFPEYYNKVYAHEGAEQSFRTNRLRYRVDGWLMPLASLLKRYCRPLYTLGKGTVRGGILLLERLRLVR